MVTPASRIRSRSSWSTMRAPTAAPSRSETRTRISTKSSGIDVSLFIIKTKSPAPLLWASAYSIPMCVAPVHQSSRDDRSTTTPGSSRRSTSGVPSVEPPSATMISRLRKVCRRKPRMHSRVSASRLKTGITTNTRETPSNPLRSDGASFTGRSSFRLSRFFETPAGVQDRDRMGAQGELTGPIVVAVSNLELKRVSNVVAVLRLTPPGRHHRVGDGIAAWDERDAGNRADETTVLWERAERCPAEAARMQEEREVVCGPNIQGDHDLRLWRLRRTVEIEPHLGALASAHTLYRLAPRIPKLNRGHANAAVSEPIRSVLEPDVRRFHSLQIEVEGLQLGPVETDPSMA